MVGVALDVDDLGPFAFLDVARLYMMMPQATEQ